MMVLERWWNGGECVSLSRRKQWEQYSSGEGGTVTACASVRVSAGSGLVV